MVQCLSEGSKVAGNEKLELLQVDIYPHQGLVTENLLFRK